ncbi:hypothetical protein HK405_001278, partial [Cladochytrium tenue]
MPWPAALADAAVHLPGLAVLSAGRFTRPTTVTSMTAASPPDHPAFNIGSPAPLGRMLFPPVKRGPGLHPIVLAVDTSSESPGSPGGLPASPEAAFYKIVEVICAGILPVLVLDNAGLFTAPLKSLADILQIPSVVVESSGSRCRAICAALDAAGVVDGVLARDHSPLLLGARRTVTPAAPPARQRRRKRPHAGDNHSPRRRGPGGTAGDHLDHDDRHDVVGEPLSIASVERASSVLGLSRGGLAFAAIALGYDGSHGIPGIGTSHILSLAVRHGDRLLAIANTSTAVRRRRALSDLRSRLTADLAAARRPAAAAALPDPWPDPRDLDRLVAPADLVSAVDHVRAAIPSAVARWIAATGEELSFTSPVDPAILARWLTDHGRLDSHCARVRAARALALLHRLHALRSAAHAAAVAEAPTTAVSLAHTPASSAR